MEVVVEFGGRAVVARLPAEANIASARLSIGAAYGGLLHASCQCVGGS